MLDASAKAQLRDVLKDYQSLLTEYAAELRAARLPEASDVEYALSLVTAWRRADAHGRATVPGYDEAFAVASGACGAALAALERRGQARLLAFLSAMPSWAEFLAEVEARGLDPAWAARMALARMHGDLQRLRVGGTP